MAINIPYFTNNTSTTLSGAGLYGTSFNTTSLAKTKYHILGEDVEVSGYIDGTTVMMISTLNVLGKPYYDELKKNNVSFSNEIEDFLKQKFKILERDTKIDSILEYSDYVAGTKQSIDYLEYVAENLKNEEESSEKLIEPPTF
jgi:thymidylate synthase